MSIEVSVPWRHQIGAKNSAGDMQSAPPPPAPPPPPPYSGGTAQGGPPPPPPPPPMLHSGHIPAIRIKTELNEPREIPSTIQNAMATKDKKPFTYLPGGLDLSEIRSPRMQRRLERNAQTPPSPEQVPQKSPEYQQQQQQIKPNFEPPKPVCNVRPASERVCLLPQVQHQPQLNKAPTPWMQKAAQVQSNPAPWTQNRNGFVDQVDKAEERVVPVRVETSRQMPPQTPSQMHSQMPAQMHSQMPSQMHSQMPSQMQSQMQSQPLKNNNVNHGYDSEPIQGRSFKVLQQITEPKNIYDGSQTYNSQALPLSELRKLQLTDDDRSFMNKVKSQVDDDKFLHNETDPRYRGASIPSRSFRMLQTLTNSAPVPTDNNSHSVPVNHYVSVEPVESKIYVPPSERPNVTEPHKYTGSSIPSRSFRMLQAMTGQNNEEEEENDSQNRSLTPNSFVCSEFWQHYQYLMEFHDRHTSAQQQQYFQFQQSQPQQKQQLEREQQFQQQQAQRTSANAASHIAHVLNTIDEEEASEEDKPCKTATEVDGRETGSSDSECEVTVTITLPPKKSAASAANAVDEGTMENSPVDFWQQINDDDATGGGRDERVATSGTSASETSGSGTSTSETSVSEMSASETSASEMSSSETSVSEMSASETRNSDEDKSSEDGDRNESASVTLQEVPVSETDKPDVATTRSGGTACFLDVTSRRKSEEDADSGITTLSADISLQASEKDVPSGGGGSKKYKRTCTHSRLFDFLQLDGSGAGDDHNNNKSTTIDMPWSTSGYSSAATTPSTPPTAVGCKSNRYESDSGRAEYDSYYNSWELACPYFGYDILPSKAFKAIAQQSGSAAATSPFKSSIKLKCPKIPIVSENES